METGNLLSYLGILAIGIIVYKYLVNWWFQIDKRKRYQQMQINLLIELCKRQGVDSTRLNEIIDQFNEVKK